MIDAALLLQDLKRLLRNLEADLRDVHAESDANRALQAEWQAARDAGRTGQTLADFRDDALTQAAVHWILGCVFLRFLEDNGLVERPWLAGPGGRMHLARDRHDAYFRAHPHDSDLEYLLACFDEAAALPGMAGLFDRRHNPLFRLPLSGDGAMALLLPEHDRLRGRDGTWTVVLGLSFDPRHTPADARARLDGFGERAETVAWLPSHLSDKAQRELGTLVLLDYLLAGERFDAAARHLSASDRTQARALLRNQQSQLQQRLRSCLEVAYGIADQPKDAVATPLDPTDHLRSLDGTFEPQVPVGAGLGEAFQRLLDQLFAYRFPAHPQFDQEIRPIHLRKVHEVLQEAIADPEHRVFVADRATRQLVSAIANPLNLGTVGATHFVLGHYWPSHFARLHGQHGGAMTVKRLREWTDDPRPMGLTREVQNLIVVTYAEQTNRSFFHHGVAVRPTLDRLDDELELREQALPPADAWARARERAAALFGLTPPEVLNAANIDRLVANLLTPARAAAGPLARLVRTLEAQLITHAANDADRLVTARSAMALLAELEVAGDGSKVVEALARAEVRTSEAAMARTLATAAELEAFLAGFDWQSLEALERLQDHRRAAADAIRGQLAEALTADEHVTALRSALEQARAKALRLLTEAPPPVPGRLHPPPQPPPGDGIEEVEVAAEAHSDLPAKEALAMLAQLERRLQAEPDGHLSIQWRLTRKTRGE